jgi:DNA-binding transcriptional regulator PaaX
MVCWLRFLGRVSGMLKGEEPSIAKRKALAIEILRDLEKEEGHNAEKIRTAIEREGKEGILLRVKKKKKKRRKKEEEEHAGEEERAEKEEVAAGE